MKISVPSPLGKITKPGVYPLSFEEYRSQPADGLSLSPSEAHTLIEKTPLHLLAQWTAPREAAKKADIGTVIHALIMEPFRSAPTIAVVDAANFLTKKAREDRDAALADGKTPILAHDYEAAQAIAKRVLEDDLTGEIFRHGRPETSWFGKAPATGVWVRCRPDWITDDFRIVDIKSVSSADDDFVRRRINDGGWYVSAPWQVQLVEQVAQHEIADFLWLVVEQTPPFEIRLVRPNMTTLMHGQRADQKAISIFASCVRTGVWPGYERSIVELGLNDGALYRLEADGVAEEEAERDHAKYERV
jgi:hypothetical protein